MKSPRDSDASSLQGEEIATALKLLESIICSPDLEKLLDPDDRPSTQMVYTNGVTLWLLVLQRLGGGK